jgi:hypothetical protein
MNGESLQNAYNEDAAGHPFFEELNLLTPPVGLVRQLSGVNGGIQNNLVFGDMGIVKGFISQAPAITNIFREWIINVSTKGAMTDDDVNNGFEIVRVFLMNNRFNNYDMLEEDMTKTAVRHVLWHLSLSIDRNHDRLRSLLKIYSPTRFGYEYGY